MIVGFLVLLSAKSQGRDAEQQEEKWYFPRPALQSGLCKAAVPGNDVRREGDTGRSGVATAV